MKETTIKLLQRQDSNFADEHFDFEFLRREGLKHIGELSGKIWTDHNVHDPGITIMEMLAYALLDLGYRTKLPIQDILASPEGEGSESYFTPAQILGNNPTTILDYRKLLIEIEGVCNAWLEPNLDEVHYVHFEKTRKEKYKVKCYDNDDFEVEKFTLNGLYTVIIQTEKDFPETDIPKLRNKILDRLHKHRNLGEDFVEVKFLCEEQIGICADIELMPNQDPETVYVKVMAAIDQFLSPKLNFYTLQEMLEDRDKLIEDIFAGRPFSPDYDSPGFIDTEELEAIRLKKELHLSDIYNLIATVEGVDGVQNVKVKGYTNQGEHTTANNTECREWIFQLGTDHVPVFSPELSCINLLRDGAVFQLDKFEVQRLKNQYLNRPSGRAKGDPSYLDIFPESGTYREDLGDYYSIQNEFPRVYGIGEGGLSDNAPKLRQAQALQLKGYLLFYDQLLVNFLSQLSNVRNLFSFQDVTNVVEETNGLETVPDLEKLLQSYNKEHDAKVELIPIEKTQFASTVQTDLSIYNPLEYDFSGLRFETSSRLRRDVEIEQLVREFKQENYSIHTYSSQNCIYFTYHLSSLPVVILARAIYLSEEEANIAANNMSYIGTKKENYELLNFPDTLSYSFELNHDPTKEVILVDELTETEQSKLDRRNLVLDHLLARFSEDFTNYSLLLFEQIKDRPTASKELIRNKTNFLSNYPDISANRGKGFNYRDKENLWNTDNVSGLEKRMFALTGLEDWNRKYLCNFEVHYYGREYKVVFKYGNKTIFETKNVYDSLKKAQKICATIIGEARKNEFYGKKDLNDCYQIIFHSSRQLLPLSFDTIEERDLSFNAIRNLFHHQPANDQVNVYPSKSIFLLELYNYEKQLVASSKDTFKTEAEATAQIKSFIGKIKEQNPADATVDLANLKLTHKKLSESELILNFAPLKPLMQVLDSEYRWQLLDIDNKPLLTSCIYQSNEAAAFEHYLQTIFTLGNTWEIKEDSVQLVSKTGTVIAQRIVKSATEGELVVEAAKLWIDAELIQQRFLKSSGKSFGFEVRNAANKVLLESVVLYNNRNLAENKAEELDLQQVEIVSEDVANYHIHFKDQKGRVIASTRETTNNPEGVLEQIRENLDQLEIVEVNESYTFKLLNEAKSEELLEGFTRYRSLKKAYAALFGFIADFKVKKLKFKQVGEVDLDGLELYVIDDSGQYLAFSPKENFRKKEYWDKEKKQINKFLKQVEFPISYLSESKFVLLDTSGMEVFRASKYYSTPATARAAARQALCWFALKTEIAKDIRPHKQFNGWVYDLEDEEGEPIAASIIGDREELAFCLENYQEAILQHSYTVGVKSEPNKWKHRFYGLEAKGSAYVLYESKKEYNSHKKAIEAYLYFKSSTALEFKPTGSGNRLGFEIKNDTETLMHPGKYTSEAAREAAIKEIRTMLRFFNAPDPNKESVVLTERSRNEEGYVYRIFKKGQPIAFHPCLCFGKDDVDHTGVTYNDRLEALCERSYDYPEFCLTGRKVVAQINNRYHYVLRDKHSGVVYFCSKASFYSWQEAQAAFQANYLLLIHFASDASNYLEITKEDGAKDYWLGANPDTAIAMMTEAIYTNREELAERFFQFPIRIMASMLGDKCFEDQIDCYYFHLAGENKDCPIDWLSTCCYETPEEAWEEFRHFLILLQHKANYRPQLKQYMKDWRQEYLSDRAADPHKDPCCKYITITEVLAESCVEYGDAACAWGKEKVIATETSQAFYTLEEACAYLEKILLKLKKPSFEPRTQEKSGITKDRQYFYSVDLFDTAVFNQAIGHFVGEQLHDDVSTAMTTANQDFGILQNPDKLQEFRQNLRIILGDDCLYRIALVQPNKAPEKIKLVEKRKENWYKAEFENRKGLEALLEAVCEEEAFVPIISDEKNLCYSFQIVDPDKYYFATHPYQYHTRADRDKMMEWMYSQLKNGKWAIVELSKGVETSSLQLCLALDRSDTGGKLIYNVNSDQAFNLNWKAAVDSQGKSYCLFNIPGEFTKDELPEMINCYQRNFQILLESKAAFFPVGDVTSTTFGIAIINPNAILAEHPQQYKSRDEMLAAIERTKACIHTEGMHLIEHILIRPEKTKSGSDIPFDCTCTLLASPNPDCKLPLPTDTIDPCVLAEKAPNRDPDESLYYIPGLDPYSFIVSATLPSWSKRYKDANFRNFVINTLYREAPAHIALNLLWLDPQQLCKLEEKFRQWLSYKSNSPVCDASMPCDLIECLLELKTVCPKPSTNDEGCECGDLPARIDVKTAALNNLIGNSKNYTSPLLTNTAVYQPLASNVLSLQRASFKKLLENIKVENVEAESVSDTATLSSNTKETSGRTFIADIQAIDNAQILRSKTYKETVKIAEKIAETKAIKAKDIKEIEASVIDKSIAYANRVEGTGRDELILGVMKNTIALALDKAVESDPEKVKFKSDWIAVRDTLKEKGISIEDVLKVWDVDALKAKMTEAKVIDQYVELLKG